MEEPLRMFQIAQKQKPYAILKDPQKNTLNLACEATLKAIMILLFH